jgi:hypothetical protein
VNLNQQIVNDINCSKCCATGYSGYYLPIPSAASSLSCSTFASFSGFSALMFYQAQKASYTRCNLVNNPSVTWGAISTNEIDANVEITESVFWGNFKHINTHSGNPLKVTGCLVDPNTLSPGISANTILISVETLSGFQLGAAWCGLSIPAASIILWISLRGAFSLFSVS